MTIDKSPKPLLTLTLNDIVQAVETIALNETRLRTGHDRYYKPESVAFSLKNKEILLANHIVYSLRIGFTSEFKNSHPAFFLEPSSSIDFTDFYTRNKYIMKDLQKSNEELIKTLGDWQVNHSKNHKKEVHKVIQQFRRTKSVEVATRVLAILPYLQFTDTRQWQAGYEFSRFKIMKSLKEEIRLEHIQEIKKTKESIKHHQAEAQRQMEKLTRLTQETRKQA